MKKLLLAAMILPLSGCCAFTACNNRPPNSFVRVNSTIQADCTYEDKLGVRSFKAPGQVLGMPNNAPAKLTCQAKGYKPYSKTLTASDWRPLAQLSGNQDAKRYFSEIELVMEPETMN